MSGQKRDRKNFSCVWRVPYLVALEFHFHKKETFELNNKKVQFAKNTIEKKWKRLADEFSSDIFKDFSFRNGSEASKEMEKRISSLIWEALNKENGKIKNEALSLIDGVNNNQEILYNNLIGVIQEKTGERYSQNFIDKVQEDGKDRYKNKIPPGYDDNGKKGYRNYNNICYELKYGDLIIWKDLIEYAKNHDKIEHVILVTSDGKSKQKSDLLYKVGEDAIGPRIELLHEMCEQGQAEFYIIDELEFMDRFSKEEVPTKVAKSISETLVHLSKSIPNSSTNEMIKSIAKATSALGNNILPKNKRRKVIDISELEEVLIDGYELSECLEDYLSAELPDKTFEAKYDDAGWGELEDIAILEVEIIECEYRDDFYEIECRANVYTKVDFQIVTKNPDYEEGEKEFFYEPSTLNCEFRISFRYDLDHNVTSDIEIIDYIFEKNNDHIKNL